MSYTPDRTQSHEESAKVIETKNKIKKAFFELYKDKKIEKISIKEITDLAGINRGTFYVYYMDIYDLLEKLQDETRGLIEYFLREVVVNVIKNKKIGSLAFLEEAVEANKDLLSLFLGEKAEPEFVNSIKSMAKGIVLEAFHINPKKLPIKTKYVIEYIASGQYGVISYWFQHDMPIPISEFAPMLKKINFHGPVKELLKFSNLKSVEL